MVTAKYFLNPWYTAQVRELSKARSRYYLLYSQNLIPYSVYSSFRNIITALLRNCEQNFIKDVLEGTLETLSPELTSNKEKVTKLRVSYDGASDVAKRSEKVRFKP